MKRRVAIAMVFLMIVSIIDFSGFIPVSASTLNEGTVTMEESDSTPSEDTIQTDTVSTPETKEQKEDSVSAQELEEFLEKDPHDLEEQTTSGVPEGITVDNNYHYIYANGNAITINAVLPGSTNALIYYDWDLDNPIEMIDIEGDTTQGYNLSGYCIYGGSKTGSVSATSVTMLGGTVLYLYGGGYDYSCVSGNTTVTIRGGVIRGHVYGGGDHYSSVSGNTTVTIRGGKIEEKVYGGGYYYSSVNGTTTVAISGGEIGWHVYGGGNNYSSVDGTTTVAISGGKIKNYVYGGGNNWSPVSGDTTVTISGGVIENNVFGGGHVNSSVNRTTTVTISGGEIGWHVYGGGEEYCSVSGNTTVIISGGEIGRSVYGGGYQDSSTNVEPALVRIGVDAIVKGSVNASGVNSPTNSSSQIEYEVAFYDGTTKLTDPYSVLKPQWVTKGDKAEQPDSDPFHMGKIIINCKDSNGNTFDFTTSITASQKLFIDWGYTVSYNGNGYDGGTLPVDSTVYSTGDIVTVSGNTGLTRIGYTFSGWSLSQDKTPITSYTVGIEPVTFYAIWIPIIYTVSYNGNGYDGGTLPVDNTFYIMGDNVTVSDNTGNLTKYGYTFGGWSISQNGTPIIEYTVGLESMTFYAVWKPIIYTVSYNGNGNDGGTLPVDNHIYSVSDNVTVSDNTGNLTKYGYTFGGWSISQNGTPITEYTVGVEPITFYAVWVPKPTNLLNVINGTGGGNYWEGQIVTVTADSRAGHTFTNWTSDDDVTFADSKAYKTTFIMPNKPVTVSANYSTDDHYLIDKDTATAEFGDADKKGYATITLKKTSYVYTGSEIRPVPVVRFTYTEYDDTGKQTGKAKTKKLVENVDYTLSYENNSNVGTVLNYGKILITGIGDYKNTMTQKFTITSKSIKSAVIEPIENVQATGADFTAQMSERIVVKDGVNTVSKNDYEVLYQINNQEQTTLPVSVDAKTVVKVSVTGKNNYTGTIKKTQTFTILPKDSDATSVADFELTVKVPKKGYTYSGKAMKPKITVTGSNGKKVKLNKDYKISYQNNVNAGTGTIVVSGKNNFYGSKSENFTIKQNDISKVKVKALSKIAHRETIEDLELTIKDGKRYLKKGVDYTVDFSSSKDLSLGVLKVKKVTLSVNALENSNYKGKKEVTCYIIPRSLKNKITTKIECPNVSYSDSIKTDGAKPELIIHYNGDKLEIDKDYKVTYSNNKKVGTGKAVIQGIGNYTGKRTVKFKIIEDNRE
ncbi:MAG: InlB B-repeat-containing protein [Lachnospiraceae bacterium]|nr:InlB B-repeat-containing protein [Lachnospiraceae bacterium]